MGLTAFIPSRSNFRFWLAEEVFNYQPNGNKDTKADISIIWDYSWPDNLISLLLSV